MNNRKLVLENKMVFEGIGFGSLEEVVCELSFNTAVVGYQEIISDPANFNKIICMTYPLIGNYGLTDEDYESKYLGVKGLVVKEYNEIPSNFRYTRTLGDVMEENKISGIANIDTRALMKVIQKEGIQKAMICDIDKPLEECLEIINNYQEEDVLVNYVSSKKTWYSRTYNPKYNVGVIDLGVKQTSVKSLNNIGCNVIVFPYNVTKEEILKYKPDGLFISSGPGNPNNLTETINLVKEFKGILPIFGIGLGAKVISLAYGINVVLSKTGFHGCNYPIKNIENSKVEITSLNISYIFDNEEMKNSVLEITHENVISKDIMGIRNLEDNVIGILFEPVTMIDNDSENMYQEFFNLIKKVRG